MNLKTRIVEHGAGDIDGEMPQKTPSLGSLLNNCKKCLANPALLLQRLSSIAVLAFALYHYSIMSRWLVDLPRADEWQFLKEGALSYYPSWEWLLASNGSHRILPTKLATVAQLWLDGYNLANLKAGNFVIYVGTLFAVLRLKNLTIGRESFPLFALFLLFLLSPVSYENHSWGYQSQFHFVILFSLLATEFAFKTDCSWKNTLAFLFFTTMALYSFTCGLAVVLVLGVAHSIWLGQLYCKSTERAMKRKILVQGFTVVVVLASLTWAFFSDYSFSASYSLLSLQLWDFFFNLISYGQGLDKNMDIWPGIVILFSLTALSTYLILESDRRADPAVWVWTSLAWIFVLACLFISRGRAGMLSPKTSRYVEISYMLIPILAVMIWYCLKERRFLRFASLGAYFLVLCSTYRSHNEYFGYYELMANFSLRSIGCLEDHYRGANPDFSCMFLADRPLKPEIEYARKLGVSFAIKMDKHFLKD